MGFTCPVCGYPDLKEPPWSSSGGASGDNCPCCGIEFGYHDEPDACGGPDLPREEIYRLWRQKWIDAGMHWQLKTTAPPKDWRPMDQLRNVGG